MNKIKLTTVNKNKVCCICGLKIHKGERCYIKDSESGKRRFICVDCADDVIN